MEAEIDNSTELETFRLIIIQTIIVTVMIVYTVLKRIVIGDTYVPLLNMTAVNSHAVSRSGVCSVQKVADPLPGNTLVKDSKSNAH